MTSIQLRQSIVCGLFVSLCAVLPRVSSCQRTTSREPIKISQDGLEVTVGSPVGLAITLDGVPFSASSTFYVVKPKWAGRYYGYEDEPNRLNRAAITKPAEDTTRIEIPMAGSSGEFQGIQTVEIGPGRVLRLSIDARLTSGAGSLENLVAGIFSGWVSGRSYEVVHADGSSTAGLIPAYAKSPGLAESTLFRGFRALRIDGRTGPIEILTSGTTPLCFVDYRANRYANARPIYWFGVLETPFGENRQQDYTVVIKFPPPVRESRSRSVKLTQRADAEKNVLSRDIVGDRIIPTPKKVQWGRGNFHVSEDTRIVAFGASEEDLGFVDGQVAGLQALLARDYGVKVPRIPRESAEKAFADRRAALSAYDYDPSLTTIGGAIVVSIHEPPPGSQPWHGEEYRIRVAGGAVIDAQSTVGLVNAMKTLPQLLRERSGRCYLRECDVADWPSLPVRAIHFFSGRDGRDIQVRMLRDVLGPLKINHLIYQCEYIKWQWAPEIHSAQFGMDKADAEIVLNQARRQHIEVTPLINTFGHMEWFFANGANLSLADNPAEPYAYDPLNPDVYRLTEQIYEEAIQLFRPRWFHIGHDEVTMRGFPVKEENVRAGVSKLVEQDIAHYHDYLGSRGIRTMIWGDMFLGPEESPDACNALSIAEAGKRRAALPKDIIIADWHYAPEPAARFTSLKTWTDAGFDTIACSWYHPRNVVELAKAAAMQREDATTTSPAANPATIARRGEMLGLMQTTWAGYSFGLDSFEENSEQYAAYVLAAEAAWTGGAGSAEEMPYDYRAEFDRIWLREYLPAETAGGWCVDLGRIANLRLSQEKGKPWLGYETGEDMGDVPRGQTRLGRYTFKVPSLSRQPAAVLLAGRWNPSGNWPTRATVSVNATASVVAFAAAATHGSTPGSVIADTLVTYDDDTTAGLQWKMGSNVYAIDDRRISVGCPVVWESKPGSGMPLAIHAHLWLNPYPEKRIRSFEFESADTGSALMLFGITGIQKP